MSLAIKNALVWEWDPIVQRSGSAKGPKCVTVDKTTGRIISIIDMDEYNASLGQYDEVIDAEGQLLLPGLHDAHIHVANTGESRYFLDLSRCKSISDLIESIKAHILLHPQLKWIIGVNWDQTNLGRYPNRFDLDSACSDKPMFLWRACWHIGVANSLALEKCGISTSCTEFSIPGGSVEIFDSDQDGSVGPTGILKETACNLVFQASESSSFQTAEQKMANIEEGLALCLSMGLTSVHTNDEKSANIYRILQQERKLPIRVFLTPYASDLEEEESNGGLLHHPITRSPSLIRKVTMQPLDVSDRLTIERVKIFSDGSLGGETAALRTRAPASSATEGLDLGSAMHTGILYFPDDSLCSQIARAKERGFRLEIHCIGDAAADQVLLAFERLGINASDRPIITHCQVLGRDLVEKMRIMGVIANVQPSFVPTDMRWVDARINNSWQYEFSYAWKTLLDSGVHVAGGSDSPIEHCSPLLGIHDAIFRCSRDDPSLVFRPSECLSFAEALYIYTVGASYAAACEDELGKIEPGYLADFVLVDKRVLSDYHLLRAAQPLKVIVGGDVVYSASATLTSENPATLLGGPFIPGKNGRRRRQPFQCFCHQAI